MSNSLQLDLLSAAVAPTPPPAAHEPPASATGQVPSLWERQRDAVEELARQLRGATERQNDRRFASPFSNGDLAALRRMREGHTPPPAFWRIATSILEPAGLVVRAEDELRWQHLVRLMAEAAGLHGKPKLGRALSDAKVAETRVLRVLNAEGDQLIDALRYAVRPLVVGGVPFDQRELAELILSDGSPTEGERIRRAVARAYYAAEHKKSPTETP